MDYNIRIVSTYPPRRCGIGTFSRDLATALQDFTGEVASVSVAAIDKDNLRYDIPVNMKIDQRDPQMWVRAASVIIERATETKTPTVVLLQHEYGLDGVDIPGNNFVNIAKMFSGGGLLTFVYLHTVLENPNEYQRDTIRELSEYSEGLIVTTKSAIDILSSQIYEIDESKIEHIDHGIRMDNPFEHDRLEIKREFGLEGILLATTLGLLSPDKGIQYAIPAYMRFVKESCTREQRRKVVYLIAGQHHPEFIKGEGGEQFKLFRELIRDSLSDSKAVWTETRELGKTDFARNDIVFFNQFLDETVLLKLYGATNLMILPYLNMQQISSGILADTLGSGRVSIATKFKYATEMLNSSSKLGDGISITPRGILVDPGENSIEQIAQAIDYLIFEKQGVRSIRLDMERNARARGYEMKWSNSAWRLLQAISRVRDRKERVTGRGPAFDRTKKSSFEKLNTEIRRKKRL